MFTHAIVRTPGTDYAQGLTTSVHLGAPDVDLFLRQHAAYIDALRAADLQVEELAALPGYPDACFVEDTAVVFSEAAIISNPGAASRNGEKTAMEPVLKKYKKLFFIQSPGTLDGGDVLQVEKHFFVGISERTNKKGAEQFAKIVSQYGYTTDLIPVGEGLHFKSGVNLVAENTLLVTPDFKDIPQLQKFKLLVAPSEESYCANSLFLGTTLLVPKGFPRTLTLLESLGVPITLLDMSETRKMDGGLTCLSLRFTVS